MDKSPSKNLFDLKFGWITHAGDVVHCDKYAHLSEEVLVISESIKGFKRWYDSEYEIIKSAELGSQELIEKDEHPEWHHYEMLNDEFQSECLTKLYEAGWIRFGSYGNNYELEGFKHAFTNQADKIQTLKDDAIERNIHLTITIRKP